MSGDSFFLRELPGVPPEAIDPAYKNVRDLEHAADYRGFVEKLWTRFSPIAEPDFRQKAVTALHPAFWEMYLYATLTERGLRVGRASSDGPDFVVDTPTGRVWIEATAPGPGTGPDAVPELEPGKWRGVPGEQIVMRITGAVRAKVAQHQRAVTAGNVPANQPYVIAVNSHELSVLERSSVAPYYQQALFPIGHLEAAIDLETFEIIEQRVTYRGEVLKKSGARVPTDTFLSSAYPMVSAVLHSRVDCANFSQEWGADFEVLHNPRATVPLDDELFAFCKQTRVREDGESFWLDHREPDPAPARFDPG